MYEGVEGSKYDSRGDADDGDDPTLPWKADGEKEKIALVGSSSLFDEGDGMEMDSRACLPLPFPVLRATVLLSASADELAWPRSRSSLSSISKSKGSNWKKGSTPSMLVGRKSAADRSIWMRLAALRTQFDKIKKLWCQMARERK